jgi:peptidoglycan hydrolase-like protein with peptidoglycan-binding domain
VLVGPENRVRPGADQKGVTRLASTVAQMRSKFLAAALGATLVVLLAFDAAGAAGASAGGTQAGGAAGTPVTSKTGALSTGTTSARSRHVRTVRMTSVSCTPATRCSGNPHQVSTHGTLLVAGVGLKPGMVVAFPRAPGAHISRSSPAARLRRARTGLVITVPKSAHSGHIMILLSGGRYTSSFGPIYVYRHALHPPVAKVTVPATAGGTPTGSAMDGQGMWIWYVSRSSGGSVPAIIAQAHASGVSTVFVKSSDGSSNYWGQFSPQLVAELHAGGVKVCAWQYVYGTNPAGEAALGAKAVATGADCLVIDAEAEYEGHYAAAQTYISTLRAKIGPTYPVALASFPYVSYHPSLPYSVFLAPGAAQYNAPQMYWKAIGASVDTVYANTYIANRIYGRPIFPLGQTYGGVSNSDILRFREEAVDYGATGYSFWDWQETSASGWSTLAAPLAPLTSVTPNTTYPELAAGRKGDQVLWMQEHLASAVPTQETTGTFDSRTTANLRSFQASRGIAASGVTDAATWAALLALAPVAVDWTGGGPSG